MDYQRLLFRIDDYILPWPIGDRTVIGWGLIDVCPKHSTHRQMSRQNEWMLAWNIICRCLWIINKMIGCSGYQGLSSPLIIAYLKQWSETCSLQFRQWIQKCQWLETEHRNRIVDSWMRIKFSLKWHMIMTFCKLKWKGVRHYRKKVLIKNKYPHQIYRSDLQCAWSPATSKLQTRLRIWIGSV
jgi:hypothetical protein